MGWNREETCKGKRSKGGKSTHIISQRFPTCASQRSGWVNGRLAVSWYNNLGIASIVEWVPLQLRHRESIRECTHAFTTIIIVVVVVVGASLLIHLPSKTLLH